MIIVIAYLAAGMGWDEGEGRGGGGVVVVSIAFQQHPTH